MVTFFKERIWDMYWEDSSPHLTHIPLLNYNKIIHFSRFIFVKKTLFFFYRQISFSEPRKYWRSRGLLRQRPNIFRYGKSYSFWWNWFSVSSIYKNILTKYFCSTSTCQIHSAVKQYFALIVRRNELKFYYRKI